MQNWIYVAICSLFLSGSVLFAQVEPQVEQCVIAQGEQTEQQAQMPCKQHKCSGAKCHENCDGEACHDGCCCTPTDCGCKAKPECQKKDCNKGCCH